MALNGQVVDPTVPRLRFGIASAPRRGEQQCGDRFVARSVRDGMLVAVIDGQGHGVEAAHAAELAAVELEHHAGEPLPRLAAFAHAALQRERGATLSLAWIDRLEDRLTWLGIGSAQGALVQHDAAHAPRVRSLLVRAGTLGDRLPRLTPSEHGFLPGDLLVLATDGVREGFVDDLARLDGLPPDALAARLLASHARADDDAMVVVVRYAEGGG